MAIKIGKSFPRPPIAVVLGHVDHGKTTLLDYIRKTNVAAKEAGGITQSIGAYEIEHGGKKITFIDTPGHETFSKMRTRGAKIADIAILVVAADDGVKPQTKESIKIISEVKIPFVAAINKIDKTNADLNKAKNELTAAGVLLEGYGGNISFQPISAKTGEGVNKLLDLVLLAAELENLSYDPEHEPSGVILESKLDSRRGILASGIVKDGLLKTGLKITTGNAFGKIKSLENFLGKKINSAAPSAPVLIAGFETLPDAGSEFRAGSELQSQPADPAKKTETLKAASGGVAPGAQEKESFNLIIKADVSGSLEALAAAVKNIPGSEQAAIKILDQGVGEITDGDVKLAVAGDALIIGFKTKVTKAAENLARVQSIKILTSHVIYKLLEALEQEFAGLSKSRLKGKLEVLAVFGKKKNAQIAGGRVTEGEIHNNAVLEIQRGGDIAGKAKILNIQKDRKDAARLRAGSEGGLLLDSEINVLVGDQLIERQP